MHCTMLKEQFAWRKKFAWRAFIDTTGAGDYPAGISLPPLLSYEDFHRLSTNGSVGVVMDPGSLVPLRFSQPLDQLLLQLLLC